MKRLTIQHVVIIVFAAVVVLGIGAGIYVRSSQKKAERRIEAIEKKKDKIVAIDSVRSVIESRILDSLNVKVDRQDAKIAELNKQLQLTRRSNDKLQKTIDDMRVFMPDF